jgi:hypothetical protein
VFLYGYENKEMHIEIGWKLHRSTLRRNKGNSGDNIKTDIKGNIYKSAVLIQLAQDITPYCILNMKMYLRIPRQQRNPCLAE